MIATKTKVNDSAVEDVGVQSRYFSSAIKDTYPTLQLHDLQNESETVPESNISVSDDKDMVVDKSLAEDHQTEQTTNDIYIQYDLLKRNLTKMENNWILPKMWTKYQRIRKKMVRH